MVIASSQAVIKKPAFLTGVFLIAFSVLVFQIVQTRILSVIAWYYLAFFAISVAMLGMTIGAVWVYLRGANGFLPDRLASDLSRYALATAVSIPASMMVQFSLITTLTLTVSTIVSWGLLLAAMTVPYVFAGVVVSLALTRSPFPVSQVYGVDLLGAALGCAAVVLLLNVLDGPTDADRHRTNRSVGRLLFRRQCTWRGTATAECSRLVAKTCPGDTGFTGLELSQCPYPGGLAANSGQGQAGALRPRVTLNSGIPTRGSCNPGRLPRPPDLWGPSPRMPKDLLTSRPS